MKRYITSRPKVGIELAPMVDITFLLIAYFLLNTTLSKNPAIEIELPKSSTATLEEIRDIFIYIDKENRIFVNQKEVSLENLSSYLKELLKKTPEKQVIIQGDKRSTYQSVISVIDEVHKAGITQFQLGVERKE